MAKISHNKIKQPSLREKKAKINLHQNFPIYGISLNIPAMFSVLWNVELNQNIPLIYADSYADMYVKIVDAARIGWKQLAMNIVRFSRVAGN